ncbi:MAG: aminoglycoside phosphotransferase family protein [Chloroflexota bacterium]|nr:aminoglycoside phosphotransferase family protein [Chloroflexota bacterium]
MKCVWDTDWTRRLACSRLVVDELAERGAPVPRYIRFGHEPGLGTWSVVEWLDGRPIGQLVTAELLEDVLALLSKADGAGRAAAADATCPSTAVLVQSAFEAGAPELTALRTHAPDTAALADRLLALREAGGDGVWRTEDAVHGDFLVTQLLVNEDGRLAGVIDWDAATSGDRAFDLALLFQNVHVQGDRTGMTAPAEVVARIADEGRNSSGAFGAYLAYHLLKMVGFVVLRNPRHIEWRLDVAHRVLASYQDGAAARSD